VRLGEDVLDDDVLSVVELAEEVELVDTVVEVRDEVLDAVVPDDELEVLEVLRVLLEVVVVVVVCVFEVEVDVVDV